VVCAYEQWGDDALLHLNGMFGLAIWDEDRDRLLLARDPAGIKPVYYHLGADRLVFGSELRTVLEGMGGRPPVDPVAANLFLRYRYTPSPLTMFEGVRKLGAGCRLVVEGGRARTERWWRYETATYDPSPSAGDARRHLRALYEDAVERQLTSDVPLGLLLSGGMDSGLLLALMSRHGSGWPTFTAGFGAGYADDELVLARRTATHFGASHSQVQIARETFETSLSAIVALVEEPVASPSIVPMFFLSELARRDVKVALMGQGPDELFGGYRRHLGVRYGDQWRRLPAAVRGSLGSAMSLVPRNEWLRRGVASLVQESRVSRYQEIFSLLPGDDVDALFRESVLPAGAGDVILDCWRDLLPDLEAGDELGGFQYLEVNSSLPDELLLYADKLSMHHSLEVRVPFLDQEVIRYAARLPAPLKVHGGQGKWVHRQVCREVLPAEVMSRKKRGFGVNVVDGWFRSSLSGQLDETLLDDQSLIYGFLRPERTRELVHDHRRGRQDNHKLLFSLVVLELWMRAFVPGGG
jgi:asparagine synthase (glutamine-hydrolysing)